MLGLLLVGEYHHLHLPLDLPFLRTTWNQMRNQLSPKQLNQAPPMTQSMSPPMTQPRRQPQLTPPPNQPVKPKPNPLLALPLLRKTRVNLTMR